MTVESNRNHSVDDLCCDLWNRVVSGETESQIDILADYPSEYLQKLKRVYRRALQFKRQQCSNGANVRRLSTGQKIGSDREYVVQRLIGSGGMGEVYLAERASDRKPYVLKVVGSSITIDSFRVVSELLVWWSLRHPNLVVCHGFELINDQTAFSDDVAIVLEYVEAGSLHGWLNDKHSPPIVTKQLLDIACDVAKALAYLHRFRIVHQDVKPRNVLLQISEHNLVAKLGDLGLARPTQAGLAPLAGLDPKFCSPEQREGKFLTPQSDIFSWGRMIQDIWRHVDHSIPNPLGDLLCACLNPHPEKRPTAEQIVQRIHEVNGDATPALNMRQSPPAQEDESTLVAGLLTQLLFSSGYNEQFWKTIDAEFTRIVRDEINYQPTARDFVELHHSFQSMMGVETDALEDVVRDSSLLIGSSEVQGKLDPSHTRSLFLSNAISRLGCLLKDRGQIGEAARCDEKSKELLARALSP